MMGAARSCQWLLIAIILIVSSNRASSETEISGSSLSKPKTIINPGYIEPRIDNDGNRTSFILNSSRRRRYVRFPSGPAGYVFEGGGPPIGRNIGAHPGVRFPSWRQHKSLWRSPISEYNRPVMGHRTPRLIFRDNDFPSPVGGSASSFFQQSNHLPDFEDEIREPRQQKRPLWKGDDTLCADGRSCEFFLMCWMSAGLLDGSCGGIMYACCQRKEPKDSSDYNLIEAPRDQSQPLPLDTYTENANDDRCGIPASKQTAQRRIVGGDEAGFGSFPWQVRFLCINEVESFPASHVLNRENVLLSQAYIRIGSSRCGGTLVNRFHVVTAGHCVAKASARQVQVTLGDYVVNSATETLPAYTFGVREIRVHPYFKFTPQADRFDVAVLRLDRPVHYMPHIAPICLPEKNEDFLGQYGWAAGWGALQAGSRLRPKTLQAVDVPVIDNRICERWHRSNGINVVIYDEMMCAGYRGGGKDSCQGDSGGPLMLEKTGRWYLIGIVSAGYSCAQPGQPGIYHRVAKTVDWITYVINS
ncbi:proclotting enzyme-like isoform X2 [Frieseomelitta varia]|uniref:proclotting enzyme-like isoform X2 n=1 Tax=Frieseomelitta varia TaxID=561572 RepID=UPI001CB6B1DE|nr:proclotting enzyme-like isoform X2 [Frieseomelitta varia]